MNIISVKQLREQFPAISRGIKQGKRYLLIYHSKPLAEIHPVNDKPYEETEEEKEKRIRKNVELVKKRAGGIKAGKGLTPEQINKFIDEQYDEEFDEVFLRQ